MKKIIILFAFILFYSSCKDDKSVDSDHVTAATLLGNPKYQAICYGGYRTDSRENQPTILEIKEDLRILEALKIKVVRTYNVHFAEASNLLQAITELQKEDKNFEMYVMLGAWIDCKNAWTKEAPIHNQESQRNEVEIKEAVKLANQYPKIVKIIGVGNEAMVQWATSYYVTPNIILKWVNYLQELKKQKKLPQNLWITSSDNYLSWGGGDIMYHTKDLNKLIKAVDYISLHTYPIHDERSFPQIWGITENQKQLSDTMKIQAAMNRAKDYAALQYKSVQTYMKSIGINKPVHIGETGWTTMDNVYYGEKGSKAADEYKAGLYYKLIRDWTNKEKITCFYFEAFDENWKDQPNAQGAENHFGLINLKSEAKFALWNEVDAGVFKNIKRAGLTIKKSYQGDLKSLWKDVKIPPTIKAN